MSHMFIGLAILAAIAVLIGWLFRRASKIRPLSASSDAGDGGGGWTPTGDYGHADGGGDGGGD